VAVLKAKLPVLKQLLQLADLKIKQQHNELIRHWQKRVKRALEADIVRLQQLAELNELIRETEIKQAQNQLALALERVAAMQPQLDSLRILVTM
jgi:cysteinyl-tRNA synthetase